MTDEPMSLESPEIPAPEGGAGDRVTNPGLRRLLAPLVIVLLGLVLYLPGLRWGLPGTVSWSQDTIAGPRTLGAVAGWPDEWYGRYPPLHYFLLYAAYQPTLTYWKLTDGSSPHPETGDPVLNEPHAPKIGLLLLIARIVSVVMAIAAGLGIWTATKVLTGDDFAASLAAIALMIGAAFTYFAHLGNVDVPSICWFSWSVYFYIRALQSPRWQYCALLGLFGSLAISTKDALAGVYPGMAVVLLIVEAHRYTQARSVPRAIMSALWQARWLAGLAAFVLPYLFLNGVFHDPGPYVNRMEYWLDTSADTLHAHQHRYPNQFRLFVATLHYAAGAVGWPMLAAMIMSVLYTLRKHLRTALILLAPAISYYVIVIARIDFVYSRFLFAPLALLGMLVGIVVATLWRQRSLPEVVRWGIPVAVFLLSAGYTTAIDAEMVTDSRYEAEEWFRGNVEPSSSIGAFLAQDHMPLTGQYLPRVHELGYATYPVEMKPESFERQQPDYLILTSYNYDDFSTEQKRCKEQLVKGRLGYTPVATFTGRYLGTGSSWLSLAGWGAPTPGKIGPTIIILKRDEP
jgi:hypothetical protein